MYAILLLKSTGRIDVDNLKDNGLENRFSLIAGYYILYRLNGRTTISKSQGSKLGELSNIYGIGVLQAIAHTRF